MDPSEFENTVEKTDNALNAGIFEEFLHGSQEKFKTFDILKEAGDIFLTLYNCQESLKKFPSNDNVEDYLQDLDDKALKVAEMKEDYIQRRKKLSLAIKKFLSDSIPVLSSTEESDEEERKQQLECLKQETINLIDLFKKEFDHLSSFAKFTESIFLAFYKDTREYLTESKSSIEQSVALCLSTQNIFNRVAEQFRIGDKIISSYHEQHDVPSVHGSNGANSSLSSHAIATNAAVTAAIEPIHIGISASLTEAEKLQQKFQEELAQELHAMRLRYDTEIMDLKTFYERQQRAQELALQETLEQRHLAIQQQLENSLHAKDQEISSLLQSLTTMQSQLLQSTSNVEQWELEQRKRQQSEEKMRQLILDMGNLEAQLPRLRKDLDYKEQELRQLQQQQMTQRQQYEQTIADLSRKTHQMDLELSANPPKNLQDFCFKVGFIPSHQNSDMAEGSSDIGNAGEERSSFVSSIAVSTAYVPWSELEAFILDKLRHLEHDLLQHRRQEQQRGSVQHDLQQQLAVCKQRMLEKDMEIQQLEKDIMLTQQQVLQQNQLPLGSKSHSTLSNNSPLVGNISLAFGTETRNIKPLLPPAGQNLRDQPGIDNQSDLEALLTSPVSTSIEDSNKIVQESLVKQRDRFMKARRELEEQVRQYRLREEGLQQEMDKLTQENVTLYERLTALQKQHSRNDQENRMDSTSFPTVGRPQMLRRVGQSETGSASVQEMESQSTPHNTMHELDKRYQSLAQEQYLSRLIPGHQWWATLLRALFTDPYTRQAVFLYLFILHCCVVMYICQFLTPQLQEEIEAQQKEKWNMDTLRQADLHADIHDQ
jgi:hypothetical protein